MAIFGFFVPEKYINTDIKYRKYINTDIKYRKYIDTDIKYRKYINADIKYRNYIDTDIKYRNYIYADHTIGNRKNECNDIGYLIKVPVFLMSFKHDITQNFKIFCFIALYQEKEQLFLCPVVSVKLQYHH